jgi:hypothetical protein
MAKSPVSKSPASPKLKESQSMTLQQDLRSVRVSRPKNITTIVNDVDDIDVRDGSLLLLRRDANGGETCMMVFGPTQWVSVNVDPV